MRLKPFSLRQSLCTILDPIPAAPSGSSATSTASSSPSTSQPAPIPSAAMLRPGTCSRSRESRDATPSSSSKETG